MKLAKIQEEFLANIYAQNTAINAAICEGEVSAGALLGIYKNNIFGSLADILCASFPVTEKIVGEKFFRAMAREYIRKNPPKGANMDDYGDDFAEFIDGFEHVKSLPYLADVARFEWLYNLSLLSPNEEILTPAILKNYDQEDFFKLKFRLHPACHLFASHFPVDKILALAKGEIDEKIDINSGGVFLLLTRPHGEVEVMPMEKSAYILLSRLALGDNLYQAFTAASAEDENFALEICLRKHMLSGVFC